MSNSNISQVKNLKEKNNFLEKDFIVQLTILFFGLNSGLFLAFVGTIFAFISTSSFIGYRNIFTYLIEVFLSILLYPLLIVTATLFFWNNFANLAHTLYAIFKTHKIPYLRLFVTFLSFVFAFVMVGGIAPMFEDKNNRNNSL